MLEIQDEFDPPFEAVEPAECRGPVLFNSPHSGRIYPRAFLLTSRLDLATLRRSEDSFVDDLIAGIAARGHPIMKAHFPRCYVDVNREPYELDPRMFDGRLPSFANTRSMRVAGGLGTVARVVGDAQEIYDQRIAVGEALRRIDEPLQALSPRVAAPVHAAASRFRRRHADRLPLHAVDHRRQRRAPARRSGARRPLRHQLRSDPGRDHRRDHARLRLCGQPQQALCGRLHHRALRQPDNRPACDPARDQPGALYGRAPLSSARPRSRAWPASSSYCRIALPRSRWRSCGPIGRRPNRSGDEPPAEPKAKRKGPLTLRERPKSREETPKEGDGSARKPLATALQ